MNNKVKNMITQDVSKVIEKLSTAFTRKTFIRFVLNESVIVWMGILALSFMFVSIMFFIVGAKGSVTLFVFSFLIGVTSYYLNVLNRLKGE